MSSKVKNNKKDVVKERVVKEKWVKESGGKGKKKTSTKTNKPEARNKLEATLPTNKAVNEFLDRVQAEVSLSRNDEGIDDVGRRILDKTENVLVSGQTFFNDKNTNEMLQRLVIEMQLAYQDNAGMGRQKLVDVKKHAQGLGSTKKIGDDMQTILRTTQMLPIELITSRSFRKCFFELMSILYYTFVDATGADEHLAKPLKQAFNSGQGHWGETLKGEAEQRTLEASEKMMSRMDQQDGKRSSSTTTQYIYDENGKRVVKSGGKSSSSSSSSRRGKKNKYKKDDKLQKKIHDMKVKQRQKPYKQHEGEVKQNLRQASEGARHMVRNIRYVELTDRQVDAIVERAQTLLYNIVQRRRTRDIIDGVIHILQTLRRPMDQLLDDARDARTYIEDNEHLKNVTVLLKRLLEGFSGRGSIDRLIVHFRHLWRTFSQEPELLTYFKDLRDFFNEYGYEHPEEIKQNDVRKKTEDFVRRGRYLFDPRRGEIVTNRRRVIVEHFQGARDELRDMLYNIENDSPTRNLQYDIKEWVSEMALDDNGRFTFKRHHIDQLRIVLLSSLLTRTRVPLPPVHYKDEGKGVEVTVSGMALRISDVLPMHFDIKHKGGFSADIGEEVRYFHVAKAQESLIINMRNINLHIADADLWFEHTKFPALRDSGLLWIDVGRRGIDLYIELKTSALDGHAFTVKNVECKVHHLNITLDKTHHDATYNTALKLANKAIKKAVEKAVVDNITKSLGRLNDQLERQILVLRQRTSEQGKVFVNKAKTFNAKREEMMHDRRVRKERKINEKKVKGKQKAKQKRIKAKHHMQEGKLKEKLKREKHRKRRIEEGQAKPRKTVTSSPPIEEERPRSKTTVEDSYVTTKQQEPTIKEVVKGKERYYTTDDIETTSGQEYQAAAEAIH